MRLLLFATLVALAACAQTYPPCTSSCGGPLFANIAPVAPTSSNTLIIVGDSLGYGAYGPTSCVSATNQPNLVTAANLTGTCWADRVGHFYGSSVINLAVGGSTLTTIGYAPGITRLTTPFVCATPQGTGNCNVGQTLPALNTFSGSSYFVMMQFAGVNDAGATPTGPTIFNTYLANMQTMAATFIADGIPASHILFLSGPKSCATSFEFVWVDYSTANYAVARNIGSQYADVYGYQNTFFVSLGEPTYCSTYMYVDPHPNDAGSALWAQAVENAL